MEKNHLLTKCVDASREAGKPEGSLEKAFDRDPPSQIEAGIWGLKLSDEFVSYPPAL